MVTSQAGPVFRRSMRRLLRFSTQSTRDRRIEAAIARRISDAPSMLDVGSSDGRLAKAIADAVGATTVRGVDILVQPDAQIPIDRYDGRNLPVDDESFDLVTIIDVLHHAEDQEQVLREALRATKRGGVVVIKDHLRIGRWSRAALQATDRASNFAAGIRSPGYYLSFGEWSDLIGRANGRIEFIDWPLPVHTMPWTLFLKSSYHLLIGIGPRP